jgi:hypothetical protein
MKIKKCIMVFLFTTPCSLVIVTYPSRTQRECAFELQSFHTKTYPQTHRLVYKRTRRFGNWICFRPQVNVGEKTPTPLGPLERANLNHWWSPKLVIIRHLYLQRNRIAVIQFSFCRRRKYKVTYTADLYAYSNNLKKFYWTEVNVNTTVVYHIH